jgi:hypothetical protein
MLNGNSQISTTCFFISFVVSTTFIPAIILSMKNDSAADAPDANAGAGAQKNPQTLWWSECGRGKCVSRRSLAA